MRHQWFPVPVRNDASVKRNTKAGGRIFTRIQDQRRSASFGAWSDSTIEMAKRFIDTALFRKPSIRAMKAPYKALFIYLLCECDHAGVWDVELDVAAMRLDLKLEDERAIEELGGSVVPVDGGCKWWLVEFVEFQYGELNPANRVHASVLSRLSSLGIDLKNKPLASPLKGAKDKDKDKDKDLDKDKEKENAREPEIAEAVLWPTFDDWWELYDRKADRKKCEGKWNRLDHPTKTAIMEHTRLYVTQGRGSDPKYRRDPATYLNNENWNDDELTQRRISQGDNANLDIATKARMAMEANAEHYRRQREHQ